MEASEISLRPDVIRAVLAVPENARNPFIAFRTAVSLQRALESDLEMVQSAVDAHSRAARLLKSIGGADVASLARRAVDKTLFESSEESNLLEGLVGVRKAIESSDSNLEERLRQVAGLKATVDDFFDNVFVNSENEEVRLNRQSLSAQLVELTGSTLDLALLQI